MQNFHHCKYLLDQLNKQREQSILCDCIVVIGQSHFKAHKNVLAAFSEYFGAQNDSSSINGVTFLDPSQVNEYKFQTLLDFLYTGVINIDCYNVTELLQAANYLKIESLVARCIEFSETHIESKKQKMEEEATATASVGTRLAGKRSYASSAYNYSKEYASPHAGGDQKRLSKGQHKNGCQKTTRKKINKVQKLAEKSISSYVNLVEKNELKKDLPRSAKILAYTNHNMEQLSQQCKNLESDTMGSESLVDQDMISQKPNRKRSRAGKKSTPKEPCKSAPASIKEERCLDPSVGSELNERQSKRKPLCSACGKVFSEASSLQRHMRIHKGVKPYICQLCGKAFTQCNQLKTHTRTHTGEKPYHCDICNKGFAQKCQLVFHSHMHHGEEKPYKCDFCSLQFATSSNLKIHKRIHSGEKPYVCERCGQSFTQASTLTYHLRRHTGEKPYVCDMCGKAFAVSSSLITHTRKHTGEKPYKCTTCGKTFFSAGDLNKHGKSHNGDINQTPHSAPDFFQDEDILQKAVLQELVELKPINFSLANFVPMAPEDKMLLMITEGSTVSSDQPLKINDSDSNYFFLKQLY